MRQRSGGMLAAWSFVAAAMLNAQAVRSPIDAPVKADLAASSVDVPLVKSGDFYFIDVQVNGRPLRFTLETGANFFSIGERVARQLGLPIDTMPGPDGAPMAVADLTTLRFGGATLSGVRAQVTPRFDDPTFAGDGLISLPALRPFTATLDFRNRRLRLERTGLPVPNGRDIVAISGADRGGRVDVPIRLDDLTVPAVIDTRSFIALTLPDSFASRLALVSPPRAMGSAAGPTMGTFQLQVARGSRPARIAEISIERPILTFRNRPGVVIGMPLLEQLVVTLDQRNGRVRIVGADANPITLATQSWETAPPAAAVADGPQRVVREGEAPPAPTSGQRTMGFNLAGVPGGVLNVRNVIAASSAGKLGLKEGDQLVEFDGTRAADMNPTIFRGAAARGKPVKVVVERDGKRLDFTIDPYLVP